MTTEHWKEDRHCAGFPLHLGSCLCQQSTAVANSVCKICLEHILTRDQFKALILPLYPARTVGFFCFLTNFSEAVFQQNKGLSKKEISKDQDIYSLLKKYCIAQSPFSKAFSNIFFKAMKTNFATSLTTLSF